MKRRGSSTDGKKKKVLRLWLCKLRSRVQVPLTTSLLWEDFKKEKEKCYMKTVLSIHIKNRTLHI